MDEHEIRAFELEEALYRAKKVYPRVQAYEDALSKSIANHRALSNSYRIPWDRKAG